MLAIAAAVAGVASLTSSRALAQYSFRELDTNGFSASQVRDVANGLAVGYGVVPSGNNSIQKAIAWPTNGGGRIDIGVTLKSEALGVDNQHRIAGEARFDGLREAEPAFWPAPAPSAQNFAADLTYSTAYAVQGQNMIGWGHRLQAPNPVADSAFVWNTQTQQRTPLPGPNGAPASSGRDIDGRWVIGTAGLGQNGNVGAAAWDISDLGSVRAIKLHPDGFDYSATNQVKGDRAVGLARATPSDTNHAYLWDLNTATPRDLQSLFPASWNVVASSASDLRGNTVVGQALNANGDLYAVAWNLANNTVTDLRQFLPVNATMSGATAMNDDGQIVGDWRVGQDNNVYVLTPARMVGDADNNGVINFDDYSRIDSGFNNHINGWANGDFNYDGKIDFDDYSLIDNAFNQQGGGNGVPRSAPVPEPSALIVGLIAAPLMMRMRRVLR
jgi:hypothetical protein